jgi:hypothetical protein
VGGVDTSSPLKVAGFSARSSGLSIDLSFSFNPVLADGATLKENSIGDETQFGIIRKAALFSGHAPATVKLFWDLWRK